MIFHSIKHICPIIIQVFIAVVYFIEPWHLPLVPLYFLLRAQVRKRVSRLLSASRYRHRSTDGDQAAHPTASASSEWEDWPPLAEGYDAEDELAIEAMLASDKQVGWWLCTLLVWCVL